MEKEDKLPVNNNKFSLGNTGGRPPIFETPEELEEKCAEYFRYSIENNEKATITGLTLYVGFSSRASWDDYKKREGFSYIVKRAKLTVESSYENSGTTFDMFALKNMGWKDKTETDLNVGKLDIPIMEWVETKPYEEK